MGIALFSLLTKQDKKKKKNSKDKEIKTTLKKSELPTSKFLYVVRADDKYHWNFDIMIYELWNGFWKNKNFVIARYALVHPNLQFAMYYRKLLIQKSFKTRKFVMQKNKRKKLKDNIWHK